MHLLCLIGLHDYTDVGSAFTWNPALHVRACVRCPKVDVASAEPVDKPLALSA